jgi:lysophosphatidate acyltransferase
MFSAILHYFILSAEYLAGLTVLLYMLSFLSPIAGFLNRLIILYFGIALCSWYGVFASIFLRLTGYGGLSQWATGRSFKYYMRYTSGTEFIIEDPNNFLNSTRPAVFIGNHQTELDVLMLGTIFPKYCSMTAKSSLKRTPFLGWFMALSGVVFINRANSTSARTAMTGAANEIRSKRQSVYLFPEGTRSYSKEPLLLPFKKGAFHLAVQAGVPIVPVVVANYSDRLYHRGYKFVAGDIKVKGKHSITDRRFEDIY